MTEEPIVDVSKWQGNINKAKMIQKAKGIIIRAGYSLGIRWPCGGL